MFVMIEIYEQEDEYRGGDREQVDPARSRGEERCRRAAAARAGALHKPREMILPQYETFPSRQVVAAGMPPEYGVR